MDLVKIKKQWEAYNEEFNNSEYMDIDTHTSMAMQVGILIKEIERYEDAIESRSVCDKCNSEIRNSLRQ